MKLLEKSQIVIAKNKDTAKEQAEGIKLARRVDSLREIAAREEAALKLSREKTIEQIQQDIQRESKPLEELREEVARLKVEREIALKPITGELKEIESKRDLLFKESEVIRSLQDEVKKKMDVADSLVRDAENDTLRAKEFKKRTAEILQDAEYTRNLNRKTLEETEKIKELASAFRAKMLEEFGRRDIQIAATERRQEFKDKAQDEREKELNARETLLKDREGVLERNIKRLKK